MSYLDIGKEDLADATLEGLRGIFARAGKNINKFLFARDNENGTVTIEGDCFGYSAGHVRLMGYCQVCGEEVFSRPIRRLADVIDHKSNFRPEKHPCVDV